MKKTLFLAIFSIIATVVTAQDKSRYTVVKVNYEIVRENGTYGKYGIARNINDKQEAITLACEYSHIFLTEDIAVVARGGETDKDRYLINAKWALYNYNEGVFITPFKYDWIFGANERMALCNIGGRRLDSTESYYSQFGISGGLWGYIDTTTGNEIIPPQYNTANYFHDEVAMVSKNGVTTLIPNPLLASDVDINIPVAGKKNEESFAFIFANQDYDKFSVPFANNDGKIFKEYCNKTLGIPEKNIRLYENATFGNMASAVNKIKEYAEAYDGDARFIVYYSGQGMTDETSRTPYLLPVDAVLTNIQATGYSIGKLNEELSRIPARSTLLILDACFNGSDRDGQALSTTRGVAIKPELNRADGSLMVLSASSADETAYQYKEKKHGLLTYFLLKKLQETQGDISYGALCDYVTTEVRKQSVSNSRIQSPNMTVSERLNGWQTLMLK